MTSAICLANMNIENINKTGKTEKYTYNFEYPKLTLNGKELAVNKELEKITNDNIKGLIRDSKTNPYNDRPYEGESFYKEYKNNFGVTSLLGMTYFYTGGNHGMTGLSSFNISNKTGKSLTFNDIFKPEAKKYFEMEIIKAIKNDIKTKKEETKFFRDMSTRTTDIDNAVVFFRGNNVVIRYQQYVVAPYSSGTPEFEFSKESVKNYLKI